MNINDRTLHEFGSDLKAALAPLQEKYGVTIKMGNISYTEERFTTKLTITNGQTPDEAERNASVATFDRKGNQYWKGSLVDDLARIIDVKKLDGRGMSSVIRVLYDYLDVDQFALILERFGR